MSENLDSATRVSDAERDETVTRLGEHAAAGRLEPAELDERVAAALAARTRAELSVVQADLPHVGAEQPKPPTRPRRWQPRGELAAYLSVMALLVAIWALTGADYFWPVWPALGWGVALLGPGRCGAGHRRRLSRRAAPRA